MSAPALLFSVGEQVYALAVPEVLEVAAMVKVRPIPGNADPALLGIINRHGSPLPLLDLRRFFDCAHAPVSASTLFIVVEGAGLVVDHVQGVVYLSDNAGTPTQGSFVRGSATHEATLIYWLDLPALLREMLPEASGMRMEHDG